MNPRSSSPARAGSVFAVDSTRLPWGVTAVTLATCLALSAAAGFGPSAYAVLVLALGLVMALGWPVLLGMPHETSARISVAAAAVALAAAVLIPSGEQPLRWLPLALGVTMMVTFVTLAPGGRLRSDLVESASGALAGGVVVASGMALAPTADRGRGTDFVVVALAALAAGALAELSGRRIGALAVLPVMVAGAIVGWLVAGVVGVNAIAALGLGMLLASFSYSARRMFGAVAGVREGFGQTALGIASVLLPGILVVALAQLAGI
ncbi:MAG: hypothetical protein V9F04_00425 [Dermatophilaceae bacterium]